jgi:hypothetical protein
LLLRQVIVRATTEWLDRFIKFLFENGVIEFDRIEFYHLHVDFDQYYYCTTVQARRSPLDTFEIQV